MCLGRPSTPLNNFIGLCTSIMAKSETSRIQEHKLCTHNKLYIIIDAELFSQCF
jgi:hypothetical protein